MKIYLGFDDSIITIEMYPLFPGVWVPIMDRERINAYFYPERYPEIVAVLERINYNKI